MDIFTNRALIAALLFVALISGGCRKDELPVKGEVFTSWPAYNPTIHYDFKEDYPAFEMPSSNLPYSDANLSWTVEDGWWSFFAGKNANRLVTEAAVRPMLKKLNEEFGYIRDSMGWPPDKAARNGYRSAVFLFGSGLSTDQASNTDLGGWQSAVNIHGVTFPMILLSYYPVYCFDPACPYGDADYQTNAVVHEGIHAIFSSMPGVNKKSWFHEGCNVWLQSTMNLEKVHGENYQAESFGWLSMGSILAPFIPIECYSGWLADGSFGGPDAEGVNKNFRKVIGGVQYSEVFPTFLGEVLGKKSIPWIWQNCTGHVLEGMGTVMGEEQIHRLIQEYRARICLADLKRFSSAVKNMYESYFGSIIESDVAGVTISAWKATPYASTSEGDDGWLIPEERTLPGWTGANIIPIAVTGESLTVSFKPYGTLSTSENMSCQLCYRTSNGTTVYGTPFTEGDFTLAFDTNQPLDNIVFAVVCNLDHVYTSNIRRNHYDYRLKLSSNATVSNIFRRYFSDFVIQ
jgi:hypothetical protein